MATFSRAPGIMLVSAGPLHIERVGCIILAHLWWLRLQRVGAVAILDLGLCHILKIGRRFGFGWGGS